MAKPPGVRAFMFAAARMQVEEEISRACPLLGKGDE